MGYLNISDAVADIHQKTTIKGEVGAIVGIIQKLGSVVVHGTGQTIDINLNVNYIKKQYLYTKEDKNYANNKRKLL